MNAESDSSFLERLRIAEVVTTTVVFSEVGEWDRFTDRYAPQVTIDYTPSIGDGPQTLSREEMVRFARSSMASFDATQHQITNVQVDLNGTEATARSYMRATHRIGADVWVRGGIYVHQLERDAAGQWRMRGQKRISLYEQGDATVLERAAAKMHAANPGMGIKAR